MSTLDAKILLYANTTANLTASNPTLEPGRLVFETDTGKFKIGNNATWSNTTYHPHDAADITSGTLATARLGSGTANASTVLSGNQTWVELPARKRAVTVFISGKPADGELLWRDVVTNATSFTVVANSTECVANAGTAATGAPSINVLKNGTSVGNLTWSANGTRPKTGRRRAGKTSDRSRNGHRRFVILSCT
jgi:hypothetical protein